MCHLPCQSHMALSGERVFCLVWSTGYGGCSMASNPWSICQWSQNTLSADPPSAQRVLFMVIYNLVRSTPGAEGVLFAPTAFKAGELPSAGRTGVGSPDVCWPTHLGRAGVRVHLREGGGGVVNDRSNTDVLQRCSGLSNTSNKNNPFIEPVAFSGLFFSIFQPFTVCFQGALKFNISSPLLSVIFHTCVRLCTSE